MQTERRAAEPSRAASVTGEEAGQAGLGVGARVSPKVGLGARGKLVSSALPRWDTFRLAWLYNHSYTINGGWVGGNKIAHGVWSGGFLHA